MISSIILVVVFISVLITIHEFGHLLVAKLSGIPVEVFSVGFGPALLKRKFGETEFRLSAVPLGGFIKMAGEDERAGPPPEAPAEKPSAGRGFNDKPLWVKASVIAAGPVSNLILGFIFLVVMYMAFGLKYFAPFADAAPDSPAAAAGLATGDWVLFAARETVPDFDALERVIARNPGQTIELVVLRDGARITVSYPVPKDTWGSPRELSTEVGDVKTGSPAAELGLAPGDTITSVAGTAVSRWSELTGIIREKGGQRIQVSWRRNGATFEDSVVPSVETDPGTGKKVGRLGIWVEAPRRYIEPFVLPIIGQVRKLSPADRAGLRQGDTIVSVAGTDVHSWNDFTRVINGRGGEKTGIAWRRTGRLFTESLVPNFETDQLSGEKTGEIGIWARLPRQRLAAPTAVWHALTRTGYVVVQTFVVIYSVVTRKLPGRAIGGPIMVAKIAYEGANWGAEYFIALWALLSINLFVVNMLPIPVMDGGRILLFAIEGARRRKLTDKELTWASNIGWALIGALIVFTLFNDIVRLIHK
jgi:regulator of sigma E protease